MSTKFINPNNPLRKGAMPKTASAKPQAPVGMPVLEKFASRRDEDNFEGNGTFNPRRAGSQDRMYSASGDMNASDNKDAYRQLAHLYQSGMPVLKHKASMEDKTRRMKILAAALSDPTGEGFALVGQELALPIKAMIDYEGFIRKVYRVRTLAQGELFRIAKDVRATAWSVGQDGQGLVSQAYGTYILPTEGKIVSFTEVDVMDIYQMNYDVLDRMQDTARQEIELEEDKRGIRLLNRCAQTVNSVSTFSSMSISVLENLRYQVERWRLIVDKFLINRAQITDIEINMSGLADPVTQREWNLAGYVGRYLGAHVLTTAGLPGSEQEVIQAGTLYAVTAPEYLGEMGIRAELFSEPYNNLPNQKFVKGMGFCEIVGFAVPNSRAVAIAQSM